VSVDLQPPSPRTLDDRSQPAHLPLVILGLSGSKSPHRADELLVQSDLLCADFLTV
jgi:hypothetical protein